MSDSPVLFELDEDEGMITSWQESEQLPSAKIIEQLMDAEDSHDEGQWQDIQIDRSKSQPLQCLQLFSPGCSQDKGTCSYVAESPSRPHSDFEDNQPILLAGLATSLLSQSEGLDSQATSQATNYDQQIKRQSKQSKKVCRPMKLKKVEGYSCKLNGGCYMVVAKDLDVLEAIEKTLLSIKGKIHNQNKPLTASNVRTLSLQLNQVETVIGILHEDTLCLEMSEEVWSEMFAVIKTMYRDVQDDVERYKIEMLEFDRSAEELSAFFSRNLTISSGKAITTVPGEHLKRNHLRSTYSVSTNMGVPRTAGKMVAHRKRATPKRQLASSQPQSRSQPVVSGTSNNALLPCISPVPVVRRGRPPGSLNAKTRAKVISGQPNAICPSSQSSLRNATTEEEDPLLSLQERGNGSCDIRGSGSLQKSFQSADSAQILPEVSDRGGFENQTDRSVTLGQDHILESERDQQQEPLCTPLNAGANLQMPATSGGVHSVAGDGPSQAAPLNVEVIPESVPLDDYIYHFSGGTPQSQESCAESEVMIEDCSQRTTQESQLPSENASSAREASRLLRSGRLKRLSRLAHCGFSLLPYLQDGTLFSGKNNLKMSFNDRAYSGSLKADGSIEMNGFTFRSIHDWIKSVSGKRFSSYKTSQKITLRLLYGTDGRPLEEIIPYEDRPIPRGKKSNLTKKKFNEIALVVKRPTLPKLPSASVTTVGPASSEECRDVQEGMEVSSSAVTAIDTRVDVPNLEFVPDAMTAHIKTILVHTAAEYFPLCQCVDQYWNENQTKLPSHLLADLEGW